MSTPNAVSIDFVRSAVTGQLSASESNLASKLAAIKDGGSVTTIDLLGYQMDLNARTLEATILSTIVKETCDCLKGIAQKMS